MPDNTALKVIDTCKSLAVAMNLIFIHEGQTHERAEQFSLYYGATCVCRSDTIGPIEHYLFGFRDGRSTPHPGSGQAHVSLLQIRRKLESVNNEVTAALFNVDEVEEFIVPFTRERS